MGFASSLPGMKPGNTVRNVLLGGAYLSLLGVGILSMAPLTLTYRSLDGC